MSRVCEEFGCVPSVAVRELEADPGAVFEILSLRAYAHAKAVYERAETEEQRQAAVKDPLVRIVEEIAFEIAGDRLKARRASRQGYG